MEARTRTHSVTLIYERFVGKPKKKCKLVYKGLHLSHKQMFDKSDRYRVESMQN